MACKRQETRPPGKKVAINDDQIKSKLERSSKLAIFLEASPLKPMKSYWCKNLEYPF